MNGSKWTDQEVSIVKSLYGRVKTRNIGKRIGRTAVAVQNKAQELGFKVQPRKPVCHPDRMYWANDLCRTCARYEHVLRSYGLNWNQYQQLLSEQCDCCYICPEPSNGKRLHADHDHDTGVARKLLCKLCNTGLGSFRDSPELLERAAKYLREHGK